MAQHPEESDMYQQFIIRLCLLLYSRGTSAIYTINNTRDNLSLRTRFGFNFQAIMMVNDLYLHINVCYHIIDKDIYRV